MIRLLRLLYRWYFYTRHDVHVRVKSSWLTRGS